ncbi:MAG: sugar phosphate isomerase/epimerase [Hungatella sp.]|nr:sugar phosphate isomerase/epimerase [Hungatella sp.]
MKIGIHFGHWGSFYGQLGVKTCLKQAKEAGADVFEFFPTEEMFSLEKEKIKDLRKYIEDLAITPVFTFGYPPGWDMAGDDETLREKAVEHLKRAIEGMGLLGAADIGGIVYSNWPADYSHHIIEPDEKKRKTENCINSLRKVMKTAEDNQVTVNLEIVNRFEHYLMNTAAEGIAVCNAVGSPNCKLLLDCFHMNIEEDDIPETIRNSKGYIGHFHVSEPNRKVPYHTSRTPWKEIGAALREIGYDKSVIVESFYKSGGEQGHDMRMWRDLAEDLSIDGRLALAEQGIAYIRNQFGGTKDDF